MDTKQLKTKVRSSLIMISLVFVFGIAFGTTVKAQDPDHDRQDNRDRNRDQDRDSQRGRRNRFNDGYPDLGGTFELRQTALNAGYNEGIKEGRNDRRKHKHSRYEDFGAYRNADKDYSSKLGDRGLYSRYYRMAFERGYKDGSRGQ